MFTMQKVSQITRLIKCRGCDAEMLKKVSLHLKRQKGDCYGEEAQAYKRMPDGSTVVTTVMRRQKDKEEISEQTQLKDKIRELA